MNTLRLLLLCFYVLLVHATQDDDDAAFFGEVYRAIQEGPESARSGFCAVCLRLCGRGLGPSNELELKVPISAAQAVGPDLIERLGSYIIQLDGARRERYGKAPIPEDQCESVCTALVTETLSESIQMAQVGMKSRIDANPNPEGKIMLAATELLLARINSDESLFTCKEDVEGRVQADMQPGDAAIVSLLDLCWAQ